MKKIKFLLAAATLLFSAGAWAQTNLIAGWDGGDDTSSPSKFGWTSSANRTLQPRNNNGGIRMTTTYSGYKLENGTGYTYSASSDPSSVIFWLRYNSSGESFTYTFQGLEPNSYYDFSALVGWHNNSSNPTFTIVINDGTTNLTSVSKAISTKTTLYSVSSRFKTPSTITNTTDIKIVFTCNQTGDCMEAVSALQLVNVVVKDELQAALTYANRVHTKLSNSTLASAITTAQGVYDNASATQAQVNNAITTLNQAVAAAIVEDSPSDVSWVLANPGFEGCEVTTTNAAATGSAAPLDIAGEWTQVSSAAWSSSAVVAYGGDGQVNGASAPSTDDAGNSGNTLGVSVGWGGQVTYQSPAILLPAGVYTLKIKGYNANTEAQFTSKFGFVPTEGDATLSSKNTFTASTWETDEVTFTLNAATEGKIQVGGQAVSGGSGSNAKVFFDNITIGYENPLAGAITAWNNAHSALAALDATALPDAAETAITTELAKQRPETQEEIVSATAALQALIDSYNDIKAAYDEYKALKATIEDLKNTSKYTFTGDEALSTFNSTLSDIDEDAEAATDAATLTALLPSLKTAGNTFVSAIDSNDGFDVTYNIVNNSFETGALSPWTTNGSNDTGVKENSNGTYTTTGVDGSYLFNTWNNGAGSKVSQTLSDLPEGYYTVTALVASDKGNTINILAGATTKTVNADETNGKNQFVEGTTDKTLVSDGSLEIGTNSATWYKSDNFRLTYYTMKAGAAEAWAAAKAAAEAARDDAAYINVAGSEKTNLLAEIAKDEPTTAEAYGTATTALQEATSAFTAAKDSYDAYVAAKAEATDVNEADVLAVVIADNTAATAADALTASIILPKAQTNKDATYAAPVLTDFVVNGTFTDNVNGWTCTGGFQNQARASNQNGAFTVPFFENWNPDAKVNKMYQTINNIPNGTYRLDIAAFVSILAAAPNESQYVFANNDKTYLTTGEPTAYEVYTFVTNNTIEIGLEQTTATAEWMGIDNVSLNYYGAGDVVNDLKFVAYKSALDDAVAAAAVLEGTIPAAAYTALNAVVTENNKAYSSAEGYEAATNAINNAVTSARVLVTPYAAYKAAANDAAIAGVASETISAQNAAVEEATTTEAIEACTNVLKTAADSVSGFDITTFTITNPTAQNKTGWEGTDFGDQSDGVCEYWNKSGAGFHQTISLPAGSYRLTVVALQRTGMTGTVYVGDKSTTIAQVSSGEVNSRGAAATWFNNGNGRNYVYFTLAEAGNVTIGLTADATTNDHWTVWKSFKLETFQESIAADYFADYYPTLVESAQATLDNATYANVTGNERTALEDAIEATPSTVAEYEAAVNAINNAVAAFTAAKANYDKYVAYKNETVVLFGSDLNVAAPTSAAVADDAIHALNKAQYNKVANDYTFSATGLIGDFGSWTGTATVAGNPAEPNYLENEHWSGQTHAYYEQASSGWGSQTGWTIKYEKTCTLPAGSYVIKVAARSSAGTTSSVTCTATETKISLPNAGASARGIKKNGESGWDGENSEYARDGVGYGWQWRFLPFTLTEQTEVTMTFSAEASTQYQWMSIADGELLSTTKLAQDVAYNETETNTITNTIIADVTMTRTIKEGFNTVCLPFTLTANQVTAAFGTGTEVYAYSETVGDDPEDVTINFTKGDGSITANVPVLVKATVASNSQEFQGVQIIAPTDVKVDGHFFNFVGVYAPTEVKQDDWFIGNGALYESKGNTNIKAFRAYLALQNPVQNVKLFIDDEEIATAISEINGNEAENGTIYNLAGQRINKMQKGINIVNGKKIMK